MNTEVMTIKEVAEYLKIKEKTAYHHASNGQIPGFKVGGSWRFRKSEIDRWIKQQEKKATVRMVSDLQPLAYHRARDWILPFPARTRP